MVKTLGMILFLVFMFSYCNTNITSNEHTDINESDLLIHNFDQKLPEGFHLFTHSDQNDNGGSVVNYAESIINGKTVGKVEYVLDKKEYQWDPYVTLSLRPNTPLYDASEFDGIMYRYKGDAHVFIAETDLVTDWAHHEFKVPSSSDWKTVQISFNRDLNQPNWGKQIPFPPKRISGFAWRVNGKTGDSGSFMVEYFYLKKQIPFTPRNDMKILEPEIPDLIEVSTKSITNPLHEKAKRYLTKGVNLTNWLEVDVPFTGEYVYDGARIDKFASQGFKGIRLPIDLDKWVINRDDVIAGTEPFTLDSTLFEIIDSLLLWTNRNNMSLTIDYHQYDGSLNRNTVIDPGYRAMAANCWKAVAYFCATIDRDDIFFELTNEPGIYDDVPNDQWRILAQEMLDSIRKVNTRHTVIYGESRWYDIEVLVQNTPFAPDDGNIIYAFHFYEPFIFTHQGASWAEGLEHSKNTHFPYSKDSWSTELSHFGISDAAPQWVKSQFQEYYRHGNKNAMMNKIIPAKNWAIEHNVAIICNEFGAYQVQADQNSLVNYFTAIIDIFSELDIPWAVWFGTFDNNNDLLPGMEQALRLK
ncbi:Endo-1,4-beta-glucanase [Chitinispirillum alkaliphilum]|nr:Endo-1,4-beta-glucanase [Chitinispirillum alkaliphilum]